MIRVAPYILFLSLTACMYPAGSSQPFVRPEGMGQYQRPAYLNPAPTPRIPVVDACRSQLYQGLVGRPEGGIYIPGLPNPKRILKPAFDEGFDYMPEDTFASEPALIEVREYLPGQSLYAPSIQTVTDLVRLGPSQEDRLTIELDIEGLVQEIRCE